MSKVEKAGEQAGGFSSTDRTKARHAWSIYRDEIDGSGLRCDFDLLPGDVEAFMSDRYLSPIDHFLNLKRFQRRVRKFGKFVTILKDFQGRPVTVPLPGREGQTLTQKINKAHFATYRNFRDALGDYSEVLVEHGPNSAQVFRAASNLAQLINPHEWRQAGYTALPEGTRSIMDFDTPGYLRGVMLAVRD